MLPAEDIPIRAGAVGVAESLGSGGDRDPLVREIGRGLEF
jgi:hypothetical protein